MFSIDNLGEKTLNKIAEMALMSQINDAKKLTVEIKTDPAQLAKGMLNSLAINGEGLIMNKSLRMQQMRINLNTIAVKPFPALLGNIQLTQPSQGTIDIVFHESDIENILKSTLSDLDDVKCNIVRERDIEIDLRLKDRSSLILRLKPEIDKGNLEIKVLESRSNSPISPGLITAVLKSLETLLNLEHFQIDGVSVKTGSIFLDRALIHVCGIASITHFPKG